MKEAACRLNIRDTTEPTSLLCSWNVSGKSVEPAPLKHITFDRPKKTLLPQDNPPTTYKKHYATKHPQLEDYPLSEDELRRIYHTDPDIALFKSLDTSDFITANSITRNDSETNTSSETDENVIPEPLTSLFDPNCKSIRYRYEKCSKKTI